MSSLTRLSISRPILMLMLIFILVLFGVQAYTGLNIENMPETDIPIVTVLVTYPGATPQDVTDNVLRPMEDAVSAISGIKRMNATGQENFGSLVIEFADGTDGQQAAIDVDREIKAIRSDLPDGIQEPRIEKLDLNAQPILFMMLSGPQGADALYNLADTALVPRLQTVNGVGSINISGGRERQVQVRVNPAQLAAYNLPLTAVGNALERENVTATAGNVDSQDESIAVRSVGEFQSLADIENLVVGTAFGTAPLPPSIANELDIPDIVPVEGLDPGETGLIYMRNIATVRDDFEDTTRIVRNNGQEAVMLTVVKAGDANAVEVAQAVKAEVEAFRTDLPPGADLQVIIDDTLFTQAAVEGVQGDLIAAIVITGIVLLFFLHTINSAAVVVMTVPVALAITFLGMALFGFTLNTLTLLALTVAIGSLVDDAIVITENTERHTQMGKSPQQAAFDATNELGFTSMATTAVGVIVYIPVAMMEGTVGQFFYPYGITVAIAFLVSLFLAFTLTPLLAAWWMPDPAKADEPPRGLLKVLAIVTRPLVWLWFKVIIRIFEAFFTALADGYRWLLRLALKNPLTQLLVVAICAAAVYGGIWFIQSGKVANAFVPYQDDALITVTVEMPPGTSLAATNRATQRVEDIIRREVPETGAILTMVGAENNTAEGNSRNFANLTVVLNDKRLRDRSPLQVIRELRPYFAAVPGANIYAVAGDADLLDFELYGPDPESVLALANQLMPQIAAVPGAADVRTPGVGRAVQEQIVIDRSRAKELGLSSGQIAGSLRTAINGTTEGTFSPSGSADEFDIVLRLVEDARSDLGQIMQIPLGYVQNTPIRVGQVADLEAAVVSSRIQRANRQYAVTVYVTPLGRGSTDVLNDITTLLDDVNFAPGSGYGLGAESQRISEGNSQLIIALATALVLVYILMVGLYESFLQPLAVMSALPVTLVGAVGGLYLTGQSINIISMLGIIMLAGLVTKNAILLVDLANELRKEPGLPIKEALITAGHQRLRAILMTALSLVFALIPLLLNNGLGSELRQPMAAVVIGGTLVSVAFFIFLVPVAYNFFEGVGQALGWLSRRVVGLGDEAGIEAKAET